MTLLRTTIVILGALFVLYLLGRLRSLRRKARAAELEALQARGEASRFTTLIGHEIRNPLTAILGISEILSQSHPSGPMRETIHNLRGAVSTLQLLASNLLGVVAADAPDAVELTEVSIDDLIAELQDSLSLQPAELRTPLDVHREPGSPFAVKTDPRHLRTILLNILLHSMASTERGRTSLIVHAKPVEPSTHLTTLSITIVDSGRMLAAKAQSTMFEPFGLHDHVRDGNPPGTGLNLYGAKHYARLLKGAVDYRPHATGGNIYEVSIPVELTQATAPAMGNGSAQVVNISDVYINHRRQVPSKRILVAEDQRSNQQVVVGMLTQAGHKVTVANDGEEALDAMHSDAFDLVITDLRLPRTHGLDVIRLSRFSDFARHVSTRFIVLSGENVSQSKRNSLAAGASAFLAKPVTAQRLLDTIADVLGRESPPIRVEGMPGLSIIDSRVVHAIIEAGAHNISLSRKIRDSIRDTLRYVKDATHPRVLRDIAYVRRRVSAIRGTAFTMGATKVIATCIAIDALSDEEFIEQWPSLALQVGHEVNEANEALTLIFAQSQATA